MVLLSPFLQLKCCWKCSIIQPKSRFPSNTSRHPPLSSFYLKSVSLFHSPQSGLFTTTSSRLKLHSYFAPGMPVAMQQSKQSVILYHLHPWERRNEEGRRGGEERREGGAVGGETETGGQRRKEGDQNLKPLGEWRDKQKERQWQQIFLPHMGSLGDTVMEKRRVKRRKKTDGDRGRPERRMRGWEN